MRFRLTSFALAALLLTSLLAAACGDDDDDDTTPSPTSTASMTETATPTGTTSEPTATPTATETEDEASPTTPAATSTTPADTTTPGNGNGTGAGFTADMPDDWYVFPLEHEYESDPAAFQAATEEAASESGLPASDINLHAGRELGNFNDGAALVFMDPASGSVFPFATVDWCVDSQEQPVTAEDYIAQVSDIGEEAEVAGTVTYQGQDYEIVRYSPRLMPEITLERTWLNDGGCWIEVFLTSESSAEAPVDAWTSFIASLDVPASSPTK